MILLLATVALAAWPVSGTEQPDLVQDVYGPRLLDGDYDLHRGLDLVAERGDPVHAVAPGEVVRIEHAEDLVDTGLERFGTFVLVEHEPLDGSTPVHSAYLHLDAVEVRLGQVLAEGEILGATGHSGVGIQTDHVHLQVFEGLDGVWIDKELSISPHRLIGRVAPPLDRHRVRLIGPYSASLSLRLPVQDVVRLELRGSAGQAVLDLETEEGLCGDDPVCGPVRISPADYQPGEAWVRWLLRVRDLGVLLDLRLVDVDGRVIEASRP